MASVVVAAVDNCAIAQSNQILIRGIRMDRVVGVPGAVGRFSLV